MSAGTPHWGLGLFALPFAGFGVFMGWRLLAMVWLAVAARGWVETPATLTRLELKKGETHKVVAEYDYSFNGQQHQGDRVGLSEDADNFGDYHQRLYERLEAERDAGRAVACFVDPNAPTRALLDRDLRLVMVLFNAMFAIVFGGVGFGLLGWVVFGRRAARRRRAKISENPDEPWRAREDWAAGEVRSGGWRGVLFMGGFAVFWNLISWAVTLAALSDDKDVPLWVKPILYGFPLIGVWLAGTAVLQLTRLRGSRSSVFRLATPTGVVGGELSGVVLVPDRFASGSRFRVTLACLETRTRTRGGEQETSTHTVWEDTRLVDRTLHDPGGRRGVPVRFVIPSGEKPTNPDSDSPIGWKLSVEAEGGSRFHAEFDVPVFVTADSREGVEAATERLTDYEAEETLPQMLARVGIEAEQLGDSRLRVTKPPGQNLGMAAFMLLMTPLFGGVAIGTLWVDEGIVRWVFPIGFGLATIGLVAGGVGCLLSSSDLEINGDRWRLKSGWYGFRGAGREFTSGELRSITTKEAMSSNTGGKTTRWNHVVARLAGGDKVTLVRGLKDRTVERRLIEELRRLAAAGAADQDRADDDAADSGSGWDDFGGLDGEIDGEQE